LGLEIPKASDRFAMDFLEFLKLKAPGEWTQTEWKVKVVYWKGGNWWEAQPIANSCKLGNPEEYANRPDISTPEGWQRIYSFDMVPPRGLSRTKREIALLQHHFSVQLAEQLAAFDALVIINAGAVEARTKVGLIPLPDHELIAHEVVHIAEQLSGNKIHMNQWDQNALYESPQVEKLLAEFLEQKDRQLGGKKRFAERYFEHR
jgi:hypothetical protein